MLVEVQSSGQGFKQERIPPFCSLQLMHILVINCGSSSIKMAVVDHQDASRAGTLRAERLKSPDAWYAINGEDRVSVPNADAAAILAKGVKQLIDALPASIDVQGVAHRVTHGGDAFIRPTVINDEVLESLERLIDLAPLHMPSNIAGIRAAMHTLPDLPHIGVFDTAFHSTIPTRAKRYAIPKEIADAHQIRRFGFHGPSHQYVAMQAADHLKEELRDLRLITCHLGNGASIAAVEYGRSVETSMGATPLEGLVMGTRSGDIDAGAVLRIARREGWNLDQIETFLNEKSGLAGLSGVGNDLRDIEERASQGDEDCRLAIQVFAHRARKYIGAYAAVMGGVDAIVFTAGIGENSALMRHRIAQRFGFLGARFDEDRNRDCRVSAHTPVYDISEHNSRVRLLVIATDEEAAMARDASSIILEKFRVNPVRSIPVAVSARHVHLTQEHVEALFGPGHQLTPYRPLSQPGQFACEEKVTLIGPRKQLENVRVLGPVRSDSQVEISRTDEFFLGIDAPVRASGDIQNSPGITLEGPAGRVVLDHGVICAWRHIHMHPDDAEHFGVEDHDVVEVAIEGTSRELIFGDVLIRVSPKYRLEMHIDTDEGNAAELPTHSEGSLVDTGGFARLRRKNVRPSERRDAAE